LCQQVKELFFVDAEVSDLAASCISGLDDIRGEFSRITAKELDCNLYELIKSLYDFSEIRNTCYGISLNEIINFRLNVKDGRSNLRVM